MTTGSSDHAEFTMIKSELIAALQQKQPNIPEKDIAMCVNLMLEYMSDILGNGGRIEIRGFGSFSLHYRPPRNAHNPKTGEKIKVPPKRLPFWKTGTELSQRVDGKLS